MVVQTIGAFMAVASFALILEIPKKFAVGAGVVGAVGWLAYLVVEQFSQSVISAAFLSSLFIAIISHLFARIYKAPVTVFLVAGILPSVPGSSIYRCVYFMIHNLSALSNSYFQETIKISGAIAMAIFVVDSLFRLVQKN